MPLTDDETYRLLHAALLALGSEAAETVRANTALAAARLALTALQMALVKANVIEDAEESSTE